MKGLIYIFSLIFSLNTFANVYEEEIQEEDEDIRPIVRSFDYETIELATSNEWEGPFSMEGFFSMDAFSNLYKELKELKDTEPEEIDIQEVE